MNAAGVAPAEYDVIDVHYHHQLKGLWKSALANAERRGISQIWMSDVPRRNRDYPTREEVEHTNGITESIVRTHGDLFRGMVYIDPKDDRHALTDARRAIEQQGMIGVKLWISCFCDEECVSPIAAYAQEHRIPVLIHAWDKATGNLLFESSASHVADLAARFPALPIIMGHHGGDWIHACRHVQHLSNVYVDTSGSITDHGLVECLVRHLGAERVVFGTDCSDFYAMYAKVAAARVDEEAKRLIFSGNAERILEDIR